MARFRKELLEEIWEHSKRGEFSDMHRLRVLYQLNSRGPRRRYYANVKTHMTKAEWSKEIAKPASQGGLAGQEID